MTHRDKYCSITSQPITKIPSTGWKTEIHLADEDIKVMPRVTKFVITILQHYDDVIMTTMASQITSLTIVYSTVYSGADQRKYQSSASLAFVRGIHRGPVNSPHKWPVARKMFPFDDVIMNPTSDHAQVIDSSRCIPYCDPCRQYKMYYFTFGVMLCVLAGRSGSFSQILGILVYYKLLQD